MRGSVAKFLRKDVYGKTKIETKYYPERAMPTMTEMQRRLVRLADKVPVYGNGLSRKLFHRFQKYVPVTATVVTDRKRQQYQAMKRMWKSWDWRRRTQVRGAVT